jgi:5-methylcytosine-specific restriction endonuclease McrA
MVRSKRATASRNERGSAEDRRRRREWLLDTYRADVDVRVTEPWPGFTLFETKAHDVPGHGFEKACRCYRCGSLLTLLTLTVDRIIPGCRGGTYRRSNIRPACFGCNNEMGQPRNIA